MFVLSEKVEDTHADKIIPSLARKPCAQKRRNTRQSTVIRNTLPSSHLQATSHTRPPLAPHRGVWLSDCKVNLFWAECSP